MSGGEDVEFSIVARDKSGGPVRQAAKGLDDLGDKADRAQRKVDDLGDQTGQLARKLLEARAAAAGLAREFDKTGDTGILKDFEKINREASRLGRVMKTIKFDEPKIDTDFFGSGLVDGFKRAGLIAGDAAVDSIGAAFNALPAQVKGAAAATGLVLVGGIEGAVTAAVAAGGLAAGIALGAQDPRVKEAYGKLGTSIFTSLKADAGSFTSELLDAAPALERAFGKQEPRIKRIFDNLSKDIDPILDNVVESIDRIAPSLERASVAGGKILISLTGTLPAFTGSVGNLLDSFSDSSSGAATSLNLLVLTAAGAINVFAQLQTVMNPLLMGVGKLGELTGVTSDNVKHLDTIQRNAGAGAGLTAQQYAALSVGMGNTAVAAQALNDAFERQFTEQMGVDEATLAVNVGMSQLTETIRDNKKSLDEHTQSGQENVGVILQQIGTLQRKRDADIAAGNGTQEASEQANAAYISQLEGLRKLLYSLGLNHAKVDELIGAYEELAKPQTKVFTTVFRNEGTPFEQRSSGNSRFGGGSDTSAAGGLSSWAPARYAEAQRAEMRGDNPGATHTGPPMEVHAESTVNVLLDGEPFRALVVKTVNAAEQRSAWRAKVGKR